VASLKRSARGERTWLWQGVFPRSALAAGGPKRRDSGGGIAGLRSALTLKGPGNQSVVYEVAATRVGGRMHSDFRSSRLLGGGPGAALCGELIDKWAHDDLGLAQRFRLGRETDGRRSG